MDLLHFLRNVARARMVGLVGMISVKRWGWKYMAIESLRVLRGGTS